MTWKRASRKWKTSSSLEGRRGLNKEFLHFQRSWGEAAFPGNLLGYLRGTTEIGVEYTAAKRDPN